MRKIEPKIVAFIDERLAGNGLAHHAITTGNARQLMIEAAKTCVGIREKTGRNDGPLVELLQETIGIAQGEAWCMSFVQTMIAYAELRTGKSSPIFASEHCLTVWNKTPFIQRVRSVPLPGAIAIWRHGNSTSGHTGVVLGCDESVFSAIEGNTNSGNDASGEVVREGGGVYFTTRSRIGTGSMKIVGFLKPF